MIHEPPIGDALRRALTEHSDRFSPLYQGHLSDHGPMGALALHGLGRREDDVLDWYQGYCRKLDDVDLSPPGYLSLKREMAEALAATSADALLARLLPDLISGWARHAYHPLIRLAYAYQFAVDAEIAAALAYLKWCGPDPQMTALAAHAPGTDEVAAAFASLSPSATRVGPGRSFDDCLKEVLSGPGLASAAVNPPEALRVVSRTALGVFDGTHNFFALHLVTGAHAFRVLYPFAGPQRDAIFSLGVLAGYAAVGAPAFPPLESSNASPQDGAELADALGTDLTGKDDHDIKLAYSASSQARHFADGAYLEVALRYLNR